MIKDVLNKQRGKINDNINHEACLLELNQLLSQINLTSKRELRALFKRIFLFINNSIYISHEESSLFLFPISSKWPELFIKAFSIYGTLSGAASAIIPELIVSGLVTFSFFSIVMLTFIAPLLIVLPYILQKAREDMSKEERKLRIREVILLTKYDIFRDMIDKKIIDDSKPTNKFIATTSRPPFNSTTLNFVYLTGTAFALGIAILTTFTLSNPIGWGAVLLLSVGIGVSFSIYHYWLKKQLNLKANQLGKLENLIQTYENTLQNRKINSALYNEINSLKTRNALLVQENSSLSTQIKQQSTQIELLEKQEKNYHLPISAITSLTHKNKRSRSLDSFYVQPYVQKF